MLREETTMLFSTKFREEDHFFSKLKNQICYGRKVRVKNQQGYMVEVEGTGMSDPESVWYMIPENE